VLRQKDDAADIRASFLGSVRAAIDSKVGAKLAGFAFVAWAETGEVFCDYNNGPRSLILAGQVPQYSKDVLLAEVAVRWSKD
jgi:hypothetical protein